MKVAAMRLIFLFLLVCHIKTCLATPTSSCICGRMQSPPFQETIIGGNLADIGEFPWAANIQLRSSTTQTSVRCAGSLINDRYIVTAAHCLVSDRDNFDDITITLGMVDINNKYDNRFEVKAKRNIRVIHYRFKKIKSNQMMMTFDIAMLELERLVPWEDYPHIRPICLPENTALDVSNLRGVMSGWGATETLDEVVWTRDHCELHRPKTDARSVSNSLKYIEDIELQSNADCAPVFNNIRRKSKGGKMCPTARLTDINLCAFSPDSGEICNGDSGGGLVTYNSDGKFYQLTGVQSYNMGCNSTFEGSRLPNIMTFVPPVTDWIRDNAASGKFCSKETDSQREDGGRDLTGDEGNNKINNNEGTKYCREDSNCDSAFQWCDKTIFKVYGTCGYTQGFYIGLAVTIVLILIFAAVIFFLWRKFRQSNTEEDLLQ